MAKHGWMLVSVVMAWPTLAAAQLEDEGEGEGEAGVRVDEDEPAGMVEPEASRPPPEEAAPEEEEVGDPAAPADAPAIEVHGFVSLGYTVNVMGPDDGLNRLRVFDSTHNTFSIDVAELVVQRVPTAVNDAGFRIDVTTGQKVPQLSGTAGLGFGTHVDLQQAFASWIAPVGDGLRIDAGKFVTWAGYEVIEGYDGYNDHYSRSWLFGYAIPFSHIGARAGYAVSPKVTVSAMLANGWDVAEDNNAGKTWALNAAIAAGDKANVYLTYIGGPEQAGDSGNLRNIVDAVAVMKATDEVTVSANVTFGHENLGDTSAIWYAAALYGKYGTGGPFSVAMRGELFGDPDGYRMAGGEQTLIGVTLTPAYKVGDHMALRGDLRFDHSTEEVFQNQDEASANQLTVGLNMIGTM